jgi:DNA polymerase I
MSGLADFREVWVIDCEFRAPDGETPDPVCLVGREYHSGRRVALWRDDLRRRLTAPFDTGSGTLVVAYFASAEMSVFLALGWSLPKNLICLFAEHRAATNGMSLAHGNSLLGAAVARGLPVMEAATKEAMRKLVIDHLGAWSAAEVETVLGYCADDVELTRRLLERMAPAIDYPRALLRGRYMTAVARMERAGVPIDTELHRRLVESWEPLKGRLIEAVDDAFGVYEGNSFRSDRFAAYLARAGISWPRYPSGQLILDDDMFRSQSRAYPQLYPLRQLRASLSGLRLTGLTVGCDGRNRCMLSPFGTVTGRNSPSNSKYIFGPAKWMRHLIKPPEGSAVAYIDWVSQELGIAAALSGDERMIEAYGTGDPYIGFARQSHLVPADATKATHGALRERVKVVCLGVLYGMRPPTMAAQLGIASCDADELLRLHKRTYPGFWRWSEATGSAAFARSRVSSVFGWPMRITGQTKPTRVFNFPMQANGAEMLRLAAIAATEAGIEVCGPIHDAFLICAPTDRIVLDIVRMASLMRRAGEMVAGIPIGVEADYWDYRNYRD